MQSPAACCGSSTWPSIVGAAQPCLTQADVVGQWLGSVGLGPYEKVLFEHEFDTLDAVAEISLEDLVSMGITKIGARRKFQVALRALRESMAQSDMLFDKRAARNSRHILSQHQSHDSLAGLSTSGDVTPISELSVGANATVVHASTTTDAPIEEPLLSSPTHEAPVLCPATPSPESNHDLPLPIATNEPPQGTESPKPSKPAVAPAPESKEAKPPELKPSETVSVKTTQDVQATPSTTTTCDANEIVLYPRDIAEHDQYTSEIKIKNFILENCIAQAKELLDEELAQEGRVTVFDRSLNPQVISADEVVACYGVESESLREAGYSEPPRNGFRLKSPGKVVRVNDVAEGEGVYPLPIPPLWAPQSKNVFQKNVSDLEESYALVSSRGPRPAAELVLSNEPQVVTKDENHCQPHSCDVSTLEPSSPAPLASYAARPASAPPTSVVCCGNAASALRRLSASSSSNPNSAMPATTRRRRLSIQRQQRHKQQPRSWEWMDYFQRPNYTEMIKEQKSLEERMKVSRKSYEQMLSRYEIRMQTLFSAQVDNAYRLISTEVAAQQEERRLKDQLAELIGMRRRCDVESEAQAMLAV